MTARIKDGEGWRDGDTSFYRITAWRGLAEHIGDLAKGNRVIVVGQLRARSWETRRGSAAAWSRSRPRRSALVAVGDGQARARHQRQAVRPVQRRPAVLTLASSEAGAVVTRPGLAHQRK